MCGGRVYIASVWGHSICGGNCVGEKYIASVCVWGGGGFYSNLCGGRTVGENYNVTYYEPAFCQAHMTSAI